VKNALPISMAIPGAAGAMCSTVLDLVRWEDAMSHRRVLAESLHVAMETEAKLADGKGTKYGFGLSLAGVEGRRVVRHGGGINGFTAELMYLPADDLTVTVLTNSEGGNPKAIAEGILAVLLAGPPRASEGGFR
jgi:CubicO group peptidase (beta-lactamase class C family)